MNTNNMVDPLSSYAQYTYHTPFHPHPNIPQTLPDNPISLPNNPRTLPNNPQPLPSNPTSLPGIPTQLSNPHAHPNIYPYHTTHKDFYPPPMPYNIQCDDSRQNENINKIDQEKLLLGQDYIDTNEIINTNDQENVTNEQTNTEDQEEVDIKPDITKIKIKKPKKVKGKTSSYWNKKITDKEFKFYGCSICNISFKELTELDTHVTMHANRVTSYDVRFQNMKKRKRLKKEKKKKKKDAKVKNELDVEIKPEDGYIGTERAGDVDVQKDDVTGKKGDVTGKKGDVPGKKGDVNSKNDVKTKTGVKKPGKVVINQKDAVYKCFACNKQFALSYYLKIHVRSHRDDKPYVCNYCGQAFITASHLGRHNKRIHLTVRHQCRICYRFFNRFELLTKHFDLRHEDQKLEGEPYDYNAILPYLNELEDQFKLEGEKKPKTEDLWGDYPLEASQEAAPGATEALEALVHGKENSNIDIEENKKVLPKFEIEEVQIKCEVDGDETTLQDIEVIDDTFEPDPDTSSDEELVKVEGLPLTDDEEEYFPPGGCARSPPPEPPCPLSPPVLRKGGSGVCELCKRTFSSRSYLKVHMRTHTGEKPFSCYVCGRGFITASKMHRHVLTHDETWVGENKIKPSGADIKSETEDDGDSERKLKKENSKIQKAKVKLLKKPNKRMDPKEKMNRGRPHCCEYCDKKFLHIETLQVHKKSHIGEELILKCYFCLEPQLDQLAKMEHETTHTGPKPYLCTQCGRQYKERGAMLYHKRTHKTNEEKQFICDICSKRFDSQAKLARHIPTHSTEKFVLRYECPVCANMFHTRWHVQMHLKSHQKEGLILEENRNAVLAMVLQNARKIPKGSQDSSGHSLPTPISTEGDERSRICNICGQVFQHFYYLEEHLKTHGNKIAVHDLEEEEEKKYTCQVCSKSFKLHYYLKLHSFTHTKEKPYICQQCGKGFITKGKLKRHLETHQGLKKYQCHICYKFFTRPSYMRIHVRTIHGTQDYNFRDYCIGVPVGLGVAGGLGVPLCQISDS